MTASYIFPFKMNLYKGKRPCINHLQKAVPQKMHFKDTFLLVLLSML